MNAFKETSEDVLKQLQVDEHIGLSDSQVVESRNRYGANSFTKEKPISMFSRVIESAKEPMILMLILAGIIALGVNIALHFTGGEADFLECVGIFVAISLSIVITVVMEGRSAKAFEELSKINEDTTVKIIRNGHTGLIPQNELVVGDIIIIETGDKTPSDGRLIECTSLQADESSLTGESLPVSKNANIVFDNDSLPIAERVNMVYSGCFITGGSGKAVVTEVGNSTEFGKIAKELSTTESTSTPLQEKLAKLGKVITVLGSCAAIIVFIFQLFTFISNGTATLDNVAEAFITSIVLVVASVPEGLPTIVAASLAINIIKMSKQNALVKKMVACETIGCINVICSDKTGTLTQNRMTVIDIYDGTKIIKSKELNKIELIENFGVNSTADVDFSESIPKFIGNPTECAMLVALNESNQKYSEIREKSNIVHAFPFSSETKNMTTIIKKSNETKMIAYSKGSPEKILSMCKFESAKLKEVEELIISFQEDANRIIAFAHSEIKEHSDYENAREEIEKEMIFDGFVAISDPLRPEVFEAVERCRKSHISLKMLTGDNIVTATAISRQLKMLDENSIAVEAKDLEKLSDKELIEILPKIAVIARSTPIIKMRVVNLLKGLGNVVAVTGDGINDAPAIKNADVGIAMGITGTEVSKEASDIVLLDDSFATIVKAVHWGRGIYENFQRFIQFQLTVNLASVIVVLTSIIMGLGAPFTALQLLWVNIIMDGPPALTLGLEPIRDDLMERKPTKRNASIVSKKMMSRITINGIYISIIFMVQHIFNILGGTTEQLPTILFTLFVVFQIFNSLNSRELANTSIFKNFLSNKLMLLVILIVFCLQILITQFGGALFKTVPLPVIMWVKIVGLAATIIVVSEIDKLVNRIIAKIRKN